MMTCHTFVLLVAVVAVVVEGMELRYGAAAAVRTPAVQCECGATVGEGPGGRIIGGGLYPAGFAPWLAEIGGLVNDINCTGTLLTDRHVLTSDKCIKSLNTHALTVRLYEQNSPPVLRQQVVVVVIIIVHKSSITNPADDLYLLELGAPLQLSDIMSPVCLPSAGVTSEHGKDPVAMGWKREGKQIPDMAMANITILPIQSCLRTFDFSKFATDRMICVMGSSLIYDTKNDLGSPLLYKGEGGYIQGGLLRAAKGTFALYEKVDKIIVDWLKNETQSGQTCG